MLDKELEVLPEEPPELWFDPEASLLAVRFHFLEVPILSINRKNECSEGFVVRGRRNAFGNVTEDAHGHLVHDEEKVSLVIEPGPRLVFVKFNKILNSLAIFS